MKGPIDFYFDFASPYSYFVAEKIDAIGRAAGRNVVWRPLILWAVLKAHGMPAPMEHPAKKTYLLRDMARSARFHDLPFRLPNRFPASSHLPARAFYWLEANAPDAARPFARAMFRAYFIDDADIGDANAVGRVLAGVAGLSEEAARAAVADEGAKSALQACVAAAVTTGVWGVPYVVIDDEAFFGADRLPHIERHLFEGGR